MKKSILSTLFIFWSLYFYAQENDTTKIKLGDTKIIIIEKDTEEELNTQKEKLEKGKEEFEKMQNEKQQMLDEQTKELEEMRRMLDKQEDLLKKQALEKDLQKKEENIRELEKEVEALENGIEDIEQEINAEMDEEFEMDENSDSDSEKDNKYDWDFEDDWSSDWDNLSPFGKDKKFRGHYAGLDIGLNNYVNADFKTSLDTADRNFELNAGASWVYSLNFLEFNIPFGKNLGLVTGMGSTWNNYRLRNNVNLYENDEGILVAENETVKSYYKNTINTWTFSVPLIFEFQIPVAHKKPGIFCGIGVVGSAKVLSWGKQNYYMDGDRIKIDKRSDYLINTFRYGLTARVGFKYLKLFANYDLVQLFQEDRGPEVYPVSVGLTLISF